VGVNESGYGKIDFLWLALLVSAGSLLSASLADSAFDLSVSLSGIVCVGLTAVGRREGYLVGLYNSFSYSVVAYGNGLYGEVLLNLLFFVPMGCVGYFVWRRNSAEGRTVAMRQLDWPRRASIAAICIVGTAALGALLRLTPSQNTPFIDASTNILSIAATFLTVGRYKEQWLLYIVLNVVTIGMWALRAMVGGESGNLMVLMWSVYLLNAVFGYWRWHVGAKKAPRPACLAGG